MGSDYIWCSGDIVLSYVYCYCACKFVSNAVFSNGLMLGEMSCVTFWNGMEKEKNKEITNTTNLNT